MGEFEKRAKELIERAKKLNTRSARTAIVFLANLIATYKELKKEGNEKELKLLQQSLAHMQALLEQEEHHHHHH
uniref:light-responsive oligomer C2-5 n=1 Tax=Escherichia coli TaxID=562 RepID=UPI003FA61596